MKYLVISDTHTDLNNAINIIEQWKEAIIGVIHLGDHDEDAEILQKQYPNLIFHYVAGNCDVGTNPQEKIIILGEYKIWLLHGHRYQIQWGYDGLYYAAQEKNVQVVLVGHTHIPCILEDDGVLIMNPGSIVQPRHEKGPSYGMLGLEKDGRLKKEIYFIKS
ncbi:MAG: metallophosphoesterase [Epulopiscium sp.]|nr:metallophosphoesterase [Candidatus Epulonipiscium sp.]